MFNDGLHFEQAHCWIIVVTDTTGVQRHAKRNIVNEAEKQATVDDSEEYNL